MARPFLIGAALILFGCSSGEVSLGVQITPPVSSASSALITTTPSTVPTTTPSPFPTLIFTTPPASIDITRVRILVNETELVTGDDSGHCPGMGSSDSVASPTVVDLSARDLATGAIKQISLGAAAAGTYSSGRIEIEPLESSTTADTAALADFKSDGASVIVNGVYNGNAFELRGHFRADQETSGPIDIGSNASKALSLTVDPSGWFKDAQGNILDPTNPALHDQIAEGICHTLDLDPDDAQPGPGVPGEPPPDGPGHHGKGPHGHGAGHPGSPHCKEGTPPQP